MKIHQLPMGARFQYEGEEYVKTGPLMAAGKSGQRLIPKYAVLKVEGAYAPIEGKPEKNVARRVVVEAFDKFCTTCSSLIPEEHQTVVSVARQDFLKALD
jgi:hypothetical protein